MKLRVFLLLCIVIGLASCSNTPDTESIRETVESAVSTAMAPYEERYGDFVTGSDLETSQSDQNKEIQQYIAEQIARAKEDITYKDVEITRPEETKPAASSVTNNNGMQMTATPEYADFDNTNCVDEFTYVSDITIPDGMTITPNTIFTKIWYVQNSGTCMWNSNYKVVYNSGDEVGMAKAFPLLEPGNYIRPGESTAVQVHLLAPTEINKTYSTVWALESDKGIRFGSGPAKNLYLSSNFRVENQFVVTQNFGSLICSDDYGYITCGANGDSDRGAVYYDETPMSEAGRYFGSPGIAVRPPKGENTSVRFEFGPLRFPRGSTFYTNFGCRPESPTCDVQIRLYARETGYGERLVQEIREWNDGFMGEWKLKLDDIEVFDQDFTYIVEVQANGGVEPDDLILFTNFRIY